jgi:hypothetical protein
MFAVLVGFPVCAMVPAEQSQQLPFWRFYLSVGAALRRLEGLADIEGEVDRDQRVEDEREEAESRGPDPASPYPHSHPVTPAKGALICRGA